MRVRGIPWNALTCFFSPIGPAEFQTDPSATHLTILSWHAHGGAESVGRRHARIRSQASVTPLRNAQGFPRDSLRISKDSLGIPMNSLRISKDSLGIPKDSLRISKDSLGMPRDSLGMPRDSRGISKDSLGMPKDSLGISRDTLGMPEDSTQCQHSNTQPTIFFLKQYHILQNPSSISTQFQALSYLPHPRVSGKVCTQDKLVQLL